MLVESRQPWYQWPPFLYPLFPLLLWHLYINNQSLAALTFQCELSLKFCPLTLLSLLLSLAWKAHPCHGFISYLYQIIDNCFPSNYDCIPEYRSVFPIFLKHLRLKDLPTPHTQCAQIKFIDFVYPLTPFPNSIKIIVITIIILQPALPLHFNIDSSFPLPSHFQCQFHTTAWRSLIPSFHYRYLFLFWLLFPLA